ncbi:MAG: EAL domain-containing protein [Sphingobium sp.]
MLSIRPTPKGHSLSTPAMAGILGLSGSDSDLSPVWVAESVRMVSTFWPLFILAKICLMVVTINLPAFLIHYALFDLPLLAVTALADAAICVMPRRRFMKGMLPHRQMRIMIALVLVSGLSMGLWYGKLHPSLLQGAVSASMVQMTLALLAMTIFGHQRLLGLVYCLGLGVSLANDAAEGPILLLLILGTVAISTMAQARSDGDRLLATQQVKVNSHRARHLLTEYEQAGRGWFWETDRRGDISYISEPLARSLGLSADDLIGRPLTELVMTDSGEDVDRTLGFYLSARSCFNDVPVRVALVSDERWWAMSGCPILNEYGQFQGFRGSGSDLTEMKRSQAEVARLAQFDSLTGLANRVQMQRMLDKSVVQPNGHPGGCAMFLLDLDRFKTVNDTMGHPAGDALLREVSQRLKRIIADRGLVGRLGGDEFQVVLPGHVDRAMLARLANAVIASLSQPYLIQGAQVVIGASVGIAMCPDDGVTGDALVRNADLALYAAKGDGRGVHRFYSPDMLADAEDRRQLEEDLRHALAHGGLGLVYQPVVNARTERISGFETLLRWNHPVRGALSPELFVPIAEDAGMIGMLGEWVLRTACHAAASWPDNIRVAVNVSPLQFANPALPGIVMNALAASGLAAERLELELTESAFIHEGEATDQMFAQLKGLGVRLALDDFGTGYSSLGYLRKAPFDKIKIDRSFVRGATMPGSRNAAIITSIVSLAEALGMDTTAEGVETHEELELVRSLGCSQIQGFIYGVGEEGEQLRQRFDQMGSLAKPAGFQASRAPRQSMLRSVAMIHDGQSYVARIRNISSGGAMIEGLWNVPADTVFRLELAVGITVEARTRWTVDDRMGVQFAHPIDLRLLQTVPPLRLAG